MANIFDTVISGNFTPRLVYNSITIDFFPFLQDIPIRVIYVGNRNIALSGARESLQFRQDTVVFLVWQFMTGTMVGAVLDYARDWGLPGKQAVLTLDRSGTAAAQQESVEYNAFFSKAELVSELFEIKRAATGSRAHASGLFQVTLPFRQGT